MDILIKGMEMPKSCNECFARQHIPAGRDHYPFDYCVFENWQLPITPLPLTGKELKSRPSYCPLVPVPPHGRLIDADAFAAKIIEIIKAHNYDDYYARFLSIGEILRMVVSELKGTSLQGFNNAPTIIEAEIDDES